MKFITEPTIHLVAATQFFGTPAYRIPEDGTDAEKLGAFAAKGCYDSFLPKGRSNMENQREVVKSAHGSVLEHASASLFIEGITRACSLEIVRHRAGFAYSQRSTRYVAEEDGAYVLEPYYAALYKKKLAGYALSSIKYELLEIHLMACEDADNSYRKSVFGLMQDNPEHLEGFARRKWARGKARNLLPHALETRMTVTANYRAWRHFIAMRTDRHAEPEIRRLAGGIYFVLKGLAPTYFEDAQVGVQSGFMEITFTSGKV